MTERQILVELVKKEAENLRNVLKSKEKERLDFDNLEPDDMYKCIYGQVTGSCNSTRANFLIRNCCEKVYDIKEDVDDKFTNCKLGGKPKKVPNHERVDKYFSPIELFIYKNRRKDKKYNKMLIDYLKGLTDTLNIK